MSKRVILTILLLITAITIVIILTFQRSENGPDREQNKLDIKTKVIAEKLDIPWSIVFLPDGSAIFTERRGRLRMLRSDLSVNSKAIELKVNAEGEGGLLGTAAHPDFESNGFIYVYLSYKEDGRILNRVERYQLDVIKFAVSDRTIVLDKIPGNLNHNGGRIKFGPDGKLYITTGDAQEPSLAQDLKSLAGKILRLEDDGNIPKDNPFKNSPVYSYGHRNPQGLAWHPLTKELFATEHGPFANDEINKIEPGKNYGWPEVIGRSTDPRFVNPILSSGNSTWAPSGTDFYRGPVEQYKNDLFFATLRGRHLHRVIFGSNTRIKGDEELFYDKYGRLRDVVFGPDNSLYILTSNRDGRGIPAKSDDRIIKVSINSSNN